MGSTRAVTTRSNGFFFFFFCKNKLYGISDYIQIKRTAFQSRKHVLRSATTWSCFRNFRSNKQNKSIHHTAMHALLHCVANIHTHSVGWFPDRTQSFCYCNIMWERGCFRGSFAVFMNNLTYCVRPTTEKFVWGDDDRWPHTMMYCCVYVQKTVFYSKTNFQFFA
jgi:hypothetical protein